MDANRLKELCEKWGLEPVSGLCRRDGRPIIAREKVGGPWAMKLTEDDLNEWEMKRTPAEIRAAKIAESEASLRSWEAFLDEVKKRKGIYR